MAILGVLLGFGVLLGATMCALVWAGFVISELKDSLSVLSEEVEENHNAMADRITIIERRKTVIAEAVAAQPKPKGVVNRAWKEDAEAAD